ncbi:nuclear transport factor 2 family protein [Novosphingobium flavum]|uniref:Nuclear transport factor 2 family protein n=1 Tax=Novosphingobium flavum TaxID=1778672 RepID=A0A7X1KLE3_9SPHN|nr:nuclear transport factor 2 family protein [Novosphingobium flavum]MBC2665487.1 nuclear transport factor 2 family protein [Novosphingobium flavum]
MKQVLAFTALLAIAVPAAAATKGGGTEVSSLKAEIAELRTLARASRDRGEIENLFSRYMYLHNAFHDPEIVPLWAKKGTPGIRAQYSNNGVYTSWESITAYHAQRPNPKGKLVFHYVASPLIEVAADGQTAKGLWVMSGVESGLTDPEAAKLAPEFMYVKDVMVDGKRVWMHEILAKYGVDFIRQDGQWKIWHFHCYEIARSPLGMGWIPFAAKSQDNPFSDDLMYFGEDGKPVLMPKPDGPAKMRNNPYRTDTGQTLDAPPPVPYRTMSETFEY